MCSSAGFLRFLGLFFVFVHCMTGPHDFFLKPILVLVPSAHKCILLTLFSQAIWHLWLSSLQEKQTRTDWIWSGQRSSFLISSRGPIWRFKSIPERTVSGFQKQIFKLIWCLQPWACISLWQSLSVRHVEYVQVENTVQAFSYACTQLQRVAKVGMWMPALER